MTVTRETLGRTLRAGLLVALIFWALVNGPVAAVWAAGFLSGALGVFASGARR